MMLADHPDTEGEIYNIGTDEEISVGELAERVKAICGSDSPVEHVPYEDVYGTSFEDMRRRVPDLRKIREAVGYRPQVTLDQLLELTVRDLCDQANVATPAGLATA
jgi:UDP-glucose 4-epimerase